MKAIIEMAREAGLPEAWISETGVLKWSDLERFAALVRADERERQWVGLTDEDIHDTEGYKETREMYRFARDLEAKLKAVNGFHSTDKNA